MIDHLSATQFLSLHDEANRLTSTQTSGHLLHHRASWCQH